MKEAKQKVTIYEVKCSLCGEKIRGITDVECKQRLSDHIDNECKTASAMRDWEKRGIYKEMVGLLRLQALGNKLEKLLKNYTADEIRDELERLEISKADTEEAGNEGVQKSS